MNLFDQTTLTVYLIVVLGLAAIGVAAVLGVAADTTVRALRSHHPQRPHPEPPRFQPAKSRAHV